MPIADDGLDQTVDSGVTEHLDGRGGTDPRNETMTYQCTRTNGLGVTLNNLIAVNLHGIPDHIPTNVRM